jgi:hypothetical protein
VSDIAQVRPLAKAKLVTRIGQRKSKADLTLSGKDSFDIGDPNIVTSAVSRLETKALVESSKTSEKTFSSFINTLNISPSNRKNLLSSDLSDILELYHKVSEQKQEITCVELEYAT